MVLVYTVHFVAINSIKVLIFVMEKQLMQYNPYLTCNSLFNCLIIICCSTLNRRRSVRITDL